MHRDDQASRTGTRTPPAQEEQAKAAPAKAAGPEPEEGAEGAPATSAPDIMSRLPKTRPQRTNDRRRAATAKASGGAAKAERAPAASRRQQTPAKKPVTPARGRATTASPGPSAKPQPRAKASAPAPESAGAPSLPRLAVEGATEAVKLPLKVGGRLTLRALDAVARGLRRG